MLERPVGTSVPMFRRFQPGFQHIIRALPKQSSNRARTSSCGFAMAAKKNARASLPLRLSKISGLDTYARAKGFAGTAGDARKAEGQPPRIIAAALLREIGGRMPGNSRRRPRPQRGRKGSGTFRRQNRRIPPSPDKLGSTGEAERRLGGLFWPVTARWWARPPAEAASPWSPARE